jgi:hypothetical protein
METAKEDETAAIYPIASLSEALERCGFSYRRRKYKLTAEPKERSFFRRTNRWSTWYWLPSSFFLWRSLATISTG